MDINDLLFTTRTDNALRAAEINTVEELIKHSFEDLNKLPNLGAKSMFEISSQLYRLSTGKLDDYLEMYGSQRLDYEREKDKIIKLHNELLTDVKKIVHKHIRI